MTNYSDESVNNTAAQQRMYAAIYNDRDSAEQGYSTLKSRGYSDNDINLLMSDETRNKHFAQQHDEDNDTELGDKAMEKAGVGSAIGGTVGAVAAAIAAIGTSLVIPGLGLVVAGPLAAGLAGAGAGGLTGGIIGALVGSGIPDDQAKAYEEGVKRGGIVMGVKPRNEDDVRYLQEQGYK